MDLLFSELRNANKNRLPQFKNKHGELIHSQDGSDWSPAQWLQALVGEIGEYANLRKKYERGDIDKDAFLQEARKELADVQIYLDILAYQLRIDLGEAVINKFNEVSERIGCNVKLHSNSQDIYYLGQLRHAYSHLVTESVTHQKEFAEGLIAPIIRHLESK